MLSIEDKFRNMQYVCLCCSPAEKLAPFGYNCTLLSVDESMDGKYTLISNGLY